MRDDDTLLCLILVPKGLLFAESKMLEIFVISLEEDPFFSFQNRILIFILYIRQESRNGARKEL